MSLELDSEQLVSVRDGGLHVKHNDTFVPCDQEPIHIPGATQYHGALIALQLSSLKIEYLSENTPAFIGAPHIQPEHIFALRSFKKLLSEYQRKRFYKYVDALRDASKVGPSSFVLEIDTSIFYRSRRYADMLQTHLVTTEPVTGSLDGNNDIGYYSERTESRYSDASTPSQSTHPEDFAQDRGLWQYHSDDEDSDREDNTNPYKKQLYCSMHKSQRNPQLLILELETYNRLSEMAYDKFFFGLNTLVHTFGTAKNIVELCNLAVGYVQHVTSYERVMMYQFDEDWNGVVIAENLAIDSNADSYMGIHFPASDIPKQARDLYLLNKSRYLCNRSAPTSRLLQANNIGPGISQSTRNTTPRPLDLTFCHLRAMSPVHLIYLGNMGVESSMSIAVTVYGKLWGLICCHHMFALPVTFQARTACAYLGTLISTHLENMINKQRFDQCHQVRQLAERYWTGHITISLDSTSATTSGECSGPGYAISAQKAASLSSNGSDSLTATASPEDDYCSSCDERDYFDDTVAERLVGLDIHGKATKRKVERNISSSSCQPMTGKFRRRQDQDSRSTEDWSRMYERFVRAAGPTVCTLFGADYMLFMIQGRSIAIPNPALIPDPDALSQFAQYLQTVRLKKTVISNCISTDFPGMKSTRGLSGAIYLPLSDDGSDFAVFCKQEQIANVTWAGEPIKQTKRSTVQGYNGINHDVLMPRLSFQKWTETVLGTSSSWSTHVNPELLLTTLSVFQESLKTWKNRMLRIDGREARYRNSQLELAKRLAEESNKTKSLLLANISHEVRTPLHGVSGVIDLLLDTELPNEQMQMLREANQATKKLTSIINDLLDFSKLERGDIRIEKAAFNLEDSLLEVCDAYALRFKEKGLDFSVDIDPSLPQWTIGDANRLKQVVQNFVSNAYKYTSTGRVMVKASLVEVRDDGKVSVKIRVIDTGIGIPLDRQELIFEKFVQGDESLNRSSGGLGLGLAVSHTLARFMGGYVGLESTPDDGSEFYMVLPLEPVDHHPVGDKYTASATPSDEASSIRMIKSERQMPLASVQALHLHSKDETLSTLSSPTDMISPYPTMDISVMEKILADLDSPDKQFRVLSVEDNKLNQALICRMLQKLKYVYEVADNGQEAIDIYTNANNTKSNNQKDAFDVILMDLQMPICDGFEATRQILDFQKQTFGAAVPTAPIIAVTAQAMSGDREICLSMGMKGYVSKPIDFQVLRQLLQGLRCKKLMAEKESILSV